MNQRIAVECVCVCVCVSEMYDGRRRKSQMQEGQDLKLQFKSHGGEKDACWGFSLTQKSVYGTREDEMCNMIQRI
jgi:hypothetical protein